MGLLMDTCGTPSHLGHMDRVAATMPSQAHAGAAQEAPNIGQWEGQDVPLVRPSSCTVKGGIPSSRRYLPTLVCPRWSLLFPGVLWMVTVISCCALDGHCYFLVFSGWSLLFPVVRWMVTIISLCALDCYC